MQRHSPSELQPPPPPQCVFCKIFLKPITFPQSNAFHTFCIIWQLNFIWQRTPPPSTEIIFGHRTTCFLLRDVSVVNGQFWIGWRHCSLFNSAFIPELQPPVCSKMKGIFFLDLGKIIHPVWLDQKIYLYIYIYKKYIYIFFSYYSEDKKLGLTGRNLWKDISINWVIGALTSCKQMPECLNCTDKEWSKKQSNIVVESF